MPHWVKPLRHRDALSGETFAGRPAEKLPARLMRQVERIVVVLGCILLLSSIGLIILLIPSDYDRALQLTGHTEVLSTVIADPTYSTISLPTATYHADPDLPAQNGSVSLSLQLGTPMRLVRLGRGNLQITFDPVPNASAADEASAGACTLGISVIGTLSSGQVTQPLCASAVFSVPFVSNGLPLVIPLSGPIEIGEEVTADAAIRPVLLDATASLLVRQNFFGLSKACHIGVSLCDRFVANTAQLSLGDSIAPHFGGAGGRQPSAIGFVRIDPSSSEAGMQFNVAAPANSLEVRRQQGDPFTIDDDPIEVAEASPLIRSLSALVVAGTLLWGIVHFLLEAGRRVRSLVLVAALAAPVGARAQEALLQADQTGQALLRSRGDRCYAITPSHVVGPETSVLVTAPGREQGEGDVLRRIPAAPEPVALATLRGITLDVCPAFAGGLSLDDVLRAHAAATLALVRKDGSLQNLTVTLGEVEVETLQIVSDDGQLEEGMSGGTILVGDQPVGMLFDVTNNHVGLAARLDRIFERLEPHLASEVAAEPAPALFGKITYDIVGWNAEPVSPDNKIISLKGVGAGPWRVPADGRVDVVLKVAQPLQGLMFDLSGLTDPPQWVEVLGGRNASGPWQSLATTSLEPGDKVQMVRFPKVRLPFVQLRMGAPATRQTLAIRRLQVM